MPVKVGTDNINWYICREEALSKLSILEINTYTKIFEKIFSYIFLNAQLTMFDI